MNRNLVVIDPVHGGGDGGAVLGDHVYEKDVTLEMATKLRVALTAGGFTVLSTRDSDTFNPPTADQRAEIANRSHAVACIVLHATANGSGVHLYTSALQPPADAATSGTDSSFAKSSAFVPIPWESAQVSSVRQSLRLAGVLQSALGATSFPVVVGREPVRPLDNMMCPAVAVELAPQAASGGNATPVTDPEYQQRLVGALTTALQSWRDQVTPSAAQAENR